MQNLSLWELWNHIKENCSYYAEYLLYLLYANTSYQQVKDVATEK